jgi:[DsrC]-trisulfide reductase subunit O
MISLKQLKSQKDIKSGEPMDEASRRAFLKGSAAAVAIAPGMMLFAYGANDAVAKPLNEAVTSKTRWGLLIDAAKFTDADVDNCVKACQKENGWQDNGRPLTDAQWIRRVNLSNKKTKESFSLPMMCQHCAEPPCVDVCPTGASFKREDGIVLVDKHICIGCRYCMMACPYKARSFVHEHLEDQKEYAPRGIGTVESCTMCVHRVDEGRQPACVEAAPEGAMVFGDLNEPTSKLAQLVKTVATQQVRADLNLDPGVRYRNI